MSNPANDLLDPSLKSAHGHHPRQTLSYKSLWLPSHNWPTVLPPEGPSLTTLGHHLLRDVSVILWPLSNLILPSFSTLGPGADPTLPCIQPVCSHCSLLICPTSPLYQYKSPFTGEVGSWWATAQIPSVGLLSSHLWEIWYGWHGPPGFDLSLVFKPHWLSLLPSLHMPQL